MQNNMYKNIIQKLGRVVLFCLIIFKPIGANASNEINIIIGYKISGVCLSCEMKAKEIINYANENNISLIIIVDDNDIEKVKSHFKERDFILGPTVSLFADTKKYNKYLLNKVERTPFFIKRRNRKVLSKEELTKVDLKLFSDNQKNELDSIILKSGNSLNYVRFKFSDSEWFYYKNDGIFLISDNNKSVSIQKFQDIFIPTKTILNEFVELKPEYYLTKKYFENNKKTKEKNKIVLKLIYPGSVFINQKNIYMLAKFTTIKETKVNNVLADEVFSESILLVFDKRFKFLDYKFIDVPENYYISSTYNFTIDSNLIYIKPLYLKKDQTFRLNSYDVFVYEIEKDKRVINKLLSLQFNSPLFYSNMEYYNKYLFPYVVKSSNYLAVLYQIYPIIKTSDSTYNLFNEISDHMISSNIVKHRDAFLLQDYYILDDKITLLCTVLEDRKNILYEVVLDLKTRNLYKNKISKLTNNFMRAVYFKENRYIINTNKKNYYSTLIE